MPKDARAALPAVDAGLIPPGDLEPVGRVADSYGIDGRLKVQPFGSPDDSVLLACNEWWLRPSAGRAAESGAPAETATLLRVERARVHGAVIVARASGITDREAALRFRGSEVLVSRARFPAAADDEFYWVDLIGCEVRNREGVCLGRVISVDDHGAHALLTVEPEAGRPFLLPFVDAYVDRVDPAAARIDVDWQPDY